MHDSRSLGILAVTLSSGPKENHTVSKLWFASLFMYSPSWTEREEANVRIINLMKQRVKMQ